MIDNGQWRQVRKAAELQGWTVTETTNGYQLLAPNGDDIVTMDRLHSSSSQFALTHTVRNIKRHGFIRPPERRKR